MRQKTHYSTRPEVFDIQPMAKGQVFVSFRTNIAQEQREDGEPDYTCDEYAMQFPSGPNLGERIRSNLEAYLSMAMDSDRSAAAAEIRARRNRLLLESDASVALDRINLNIPDGITTTSLLSSVRDVFEALREATTGRWAQYRQALRDIPQQPGFPYDVDFPVKPE